MADSHALRRLDELDDQPARDKIATVLDRTLFVEAGAGSGKTRAMVDRIEALIMSGVTIDNIAAISFTDKAAAELRDRIRRRLEKARQAQDSTRTDLETGRERATRALEKLDIASLCTLHSFAQRILTDHALEAGLPPGFSVLDDIASQIEFEDRWQQFVEELLEDQTLERSLLALDFMGVELSHLRNLSLALNDNWDRIVGSALLHADPAPQLRTDEAARRTREVCALRHKCNNTEDKLFKRLEELEHHGEALQSHDDIDRLEALKFLVDHSKVRNLGTQKNWGQPKFFRGEVETLREKLETLRGDFAEALLAHVVAELARFTLRTAEARRLAGRLEFCDLLVLARQLLRDPERGPAVREALQQHYSYLLIDEFQDTDPIQIEIAVLIACPDRDVGDTRWQELNTEPHRLFFVGDPQQSIYRFRRADISTYLAAGRRFGQELGEEVSLVSNFRSVEPIIGWINQVFEKLIAHKEGSQPAYTRLLARRSPGLVGQAVALLGVEPHDEDLNAEQLRDREAGDVAAAVAQILEEEWSVANRDESNNKELWRPARPGDIAILLPTRKSLSQLEQALDAVGIPYQTETAAGVYATREVRDLLLALGAVADPSDELAAVAALRSPLYGCGDDDLAHWKLGLGGCFSIFDKRPGEMADDASGRGRVCEGHPVAEGLAHMRSLHEAKSWSTPSQLLDRVIRERAVLESAVASGRPRDIWRRLRFVVDQARAWSDAGGSDLRHYLQWARLQGQGNSRVTETVLPETDDDSVRILTVHGSKGLEFPIAVLSGMTSELRRSPSAPAVQFPPGQEPVVHLKAGVASSGYTEWKSGDDAMDADERIRLLYVACTRACDHLVVSMHRTEKKSATRAAVLFGAADRPQDLALIPNRTEPKPAGATPPSPLTLRHLWQSERDEALEQATRRTVVSATTLAREAADAVAKANAAAVDDVDDVDAAVNDYPGLDKENPDLDLPPWRKGRGGTPLGKAVHAVLQVIDLATSDKQAISEAAEFAAMAEGIPSRKADVADLVTAALETDVASAAAASPHYREVYVAAPFEVESPVENNGSPAVEENNSFATSPARSSNGRSVLVEGYIDLLYRSHEGLVIVDWKTDQVAGDDDVATKLARYTPQGAAYAAALAAATGEKVDRVIFVFLDSDGAVTAPIADLDAAIAEITSALRQEVPMFGSR